MTVPLPGPSTPPRFDGELGELPPSRSAAMQRRAMQAAMASAVRGMRSSGGRRGRSPGQYGAPPAGRA